MIYRVDDLLEFIELVLRDWLVDKVWRRIGRRLVLCFRLFWS